MDKSNVKQAHGLTHSEMEQLHIKQINGEVEMTEPNNGGDNIKDPYFAKDYKDYEVPIHERHIYHVAAEARTFRSSGVSPERTSIPSVHKLTVEAYEFQKKHKAFDGQIVHILHNPTLEKVASKSSSSDEKPVEKMNMKELEALFIELSGEESAPKVKKDELVSLIKELQK